MQVTALRRYPVKSRLGEDLASVTLWVGAEIAVGEVRLRGTLPTPRCSVPTLEPGDLLCEPAAVRPLLTDDRVDVPGFGVLPCAVLYAEVAVGG